MSGKGRPSLEPGTYGEIWVSDDGQPYKARARYRDRDGVTRTVARFGQTKAEARKRLKAALVERQHAGEHGGITPNTTLGDLADLWLASDKVTDLAVNSRATYAYVVANQVKPMLRGIRLRELTARDVNDALTKIRATSGPGSAKTTKNVLSGMCTLAVSYGALSTSPMRDAIQIKRTSRKAPRRALTPTEDADVRDRLRSDPAGPPPSQDNPDGLDLADLVDWMLGTGCRIGEALAAREGVNRDGEPLLDLETGIWEINATVIRVSGVRRLRTLEAKDERTWEEDEELRALQTLSPGLHIQERTKSDAGWRRIALPWYCVEMVKRRQAELRFRPDVPVIFPSPSARTLRDPRNTARAWRETRTRLGFDWMNFHRFRATVVTRLYEAGIDPAKVSDHVGHSKPSMTLDNYAGRSVVVSDAARILDR